MPTPRTVKSTCKFCGEFCCRSGQIAIFKDDKQRLDKWLKSFPEIESNFRDRCRQIAGFSILSNEGGCVFLDDSGDCKVYGSALPTECKHFPLIARIVENKLVLAIVRDCPISDVPTSQASIDAAVKDFSEIPDKVWIKFSLEYADESPKIIKVIREVVGLPITVKREKKTKDDNYGIDKVVTGSEADDALPHRSEGPSIDASSGILRKNFELNSNPSGRFDEGEEVNGEDNIPPYLD